MPPLLVLLALTAVVIAPRVQARTDATANLDIARLALANMEYRDHVQVERDLLIQGLTDDSPTSQALDIQQSLTDQARQEFLAVATTSPTLAAGGIQAHLTEEVIEAAHALDDVRARAASGDLSPRGAYDAMTTLLHKHAELTQILSAGSDAELLRRGQLIQDFHLGMDRLADIGAFVGLRLELDSFSTGDLATLESLVDRNEEHFNHFIDSADPSRALLLEDSIGNAVFERYEDVRTQVEIDGYADNPPTVDPATWWRTSEANLAGINVIDQVFYEDYIIEAESIAAEAQSEMLRYSIAAGAAALIALFTAVSLGRSMARRITRMANDANMIANDRLPEVLVQLNSPSEEDLENYLPQVPSDGRDEIGVLADSFNEVLRTAVQTSLNHAEERSETMTRILVNLGRRNQTLLDRQLELLDGLEAEVQDPDVLNGLFRLDHMLTRMRRNAENLLVLAAELPARQWSDSVPVLDVARGAAAEVQDHERIAIELGADSNLLVVGGAAVDLSHLLAELIDNALAYSAPTTQVAIRANSGGNHVRLWVIDQGVGLADDDMADANERLMNPPAIEAVVTDQVGFQVIGRLARRLGINVQLHPNPGGGVGACITLPANLIDQAPPVSPPATVDLSGSTPAVGHEPAIQLESAPVVVSAVDEPTPTDTMPDLGPIPDTVSDLDPHTPASFTEPRVPGPSSSPPSPFAPKPSTGLVDGEVAPYEPSPERGQEPEGPAPQSPPVEQPAPGEAAPAASTPVESTSTDPASPRKRVPGAAIASGRETINAVEDGAFRRLPTPDGAAAADHTNRALERREAMSRLQSAVEDGRQEQEPSGPSTPEPSAPVPTTPEPERSDI
ncbi:MAG: HAMP domain-containing protein [Actinomycetia bacterium]|nr:HAMP domain-containing protein [Actinomycetes bacterium]